MVKVNEIIRKLDNGKYRLYSHSGKNLGTYDTRAGAEKRERQVQYFKHANENENSVCECGCGCSKSVCETCGKAKVQEVYDPEYGHDTDDHVVKHKDDNDQNFWAVYNGDGNIVKVFYNEKKAKDYAEKNHDTLMKNEIVAEEIADFDAQDPMASKVAVQGYGTMNLATLMKNVTSTIKQLGELRNDPASYRRLNYELYDSGVLQAKLSALITALDQLQEIKRKGGKRSVNIQREANQVRGSEPIPAKQKPSKGASSPHPYRGRLVGEAEQQELPVDLEKIRKAIQQLESRNYFTPEEADEMRRAVQAMATGRDTIYPKRLLQLLTMVA